MASKSASTLSIPASASRDKGRVIDLRQGRDRPFSFLARNSEAPMAPLALQPIRSNGLFQGSSSPIDQPSAATSGTLSRRLSQSSAIQERARSYYRQSLVWFRKKLADRGNKRIIQSLSSEPRLGDTVYQAREERERRYSYAVTNEKAEQNTTPRCFGKCC